MVEELQKIIAIISKYENLSLSTMATSLIVAILCGLVVYMLYRWFYRGVVYSDNFGVLLVLVSGITAFIILTIGANLVLSLGMVGALSIVRFRAPVKEPLDVGFLYWSIAIGITAGARLYMVAIIGTVVVGIVYVAMTLLRKEKRTFLLIIRYALAGEEAVSAELKKIPHKLKNKCISGGDVELSLQVRVVKDRTEFLSPRDGDQRGPGRIHRRLCINKPRHPGKNKL